MTRRDIRDSAAARQVDAAYRSMFRPGEGHLWSAADCDLSADGRNLCFTGQCFEGTLEDGPSNAIYRLDLIEGGIRRIAEGRMLRNAPGGRTAYVQSMAGRDHLVIATEAGDTLAAIPMDTRIEALAWSPSGRDLLIVAADAGADLAGLEGGFALGGANSGPDWLPEVTTSDAQDLWRRLYRWSDDLAAPVPTTCPPVNVWEAAWLGDDTIAIVASDHHSEGSWYRANLRVVDARTGAEHARFVPTDQVGVPAGSPCGQRWAVIEAFCSDRGLVCGSIVVGDQSGRRVLDLDGVETTDIRWRDSGRLVFAGLRGADTVVGEIYVTTGAWHQIWASNALTISGWHPRAIPFGEGSAIAVLEGYNHPPAIARLSSGNATVVADLRPSPAPAIQGRMRRVTWQARDGLAIDGWLVLPDGDNRNLPLLVDIHGGPVLAHRCRYAANLRAGPVLVQKGYALFQPNPRGSTGRGQDFARMVKGDMGGEDLHDILAGIDHLIAQGIADPDRIAVTGSSYGGFMTAMLATRTDRFAAAVPISPVANWYSQHFASQIPWFDEAFLMGSPQEPTGQYFERSPVFGVGRSSTPTLVLAGGRDKNTPTGQGIELYGALALAGNTAALAVYPQDGHSLRGYPAYLDSASRLIDWLDRHLKS